MRRKLLISEQPESQDNDKPDEIPSNDSMGESLLQEPASQSIPGAKAVEHSERPRILREYSLKIIEAAFFASARPLSVRVLSGEFGADSREIRTLVRKLSSNLKQQKGEMQLTQLKHDPDKWILHLDSDDIIFQILEAFSIHSQSSVPKDALSRQLLTLIAFHQPVSRAKLWKILSAEAKTTIGIVEMERQIEKLLRFGMIVAIHKKGVSLQYEVSNRFAEIFGLEETKIKMRNQLARLLGKNLAQVDSDQEIEQE
ncbi:MAG TPA: SMC-Scp complex subunit ScpB [Candidatus Hodarchaeales archaeon]|nr:SMC-Scp complex subunit ScpB [Candidatus Hodarchaeales archaeon]